MTTFSYSTGDPTNLTGGATASMADISGPFADIKTWANGGNIDAGNLATSAKPVTLLAPWRTVAEAHTILSASNTAGFYLPRTDGSAPATANTPSASVVVFPWDPAAYAVTGLTTRVRLIVQWGTNNTASGVTWTFYVTFATIGTGTSSGPRWTFGSSVASVAVTTPAANSQGSAATSSSTAPSAGPLLFVVQSSGTPPANTWLDAHMYLQVQHV